jgi:hypothetical protein
VRRTRLVSSLIAVALTAGAVSLTQAAPASAACAAKSSHYLGGTMTGQDGRDINAQVSFDIVDRLGRSIDMNGCVTRSYGMTIWMNKNVSGNGVAHSAQTVNAWRINNLPANAVAAWIEVYTRTNAGKLCPTCDGTVDTHRYGFVNRRAVKLNNANLRLIAPLNCSAGGQSGSIQGYLMDSAHRPVAFSAIHVWSTLTPDGSKPLQGWGMAVITKGYYKIDNLASGQSYAMLASYAGKSLPRRVVKVTACHGTALSLAG